MYVKPVNWNDEKNATLIRERGISFDQVVYEMANGRIISIIENPNQTAYPNQQLLLVNINKYIYCVPFVENEKEIFLKTIYPNRKLTKELLGEKP